jgi:hypothetical protein
MTSLEGAAAEKLLFGFATRASKNKKTFKGRCFIVLFLLSIRYHAALTAQCKTLERLLRTCALHRVGFVDKAVFIEPANDAVVDDGVDFKLADFRTSQRHQALHVAQPFG